MLHHVCSILNAPRNTTRHTGKTGVFLGPQDLYFAILGDGGSSSSSSGSVAVYRTPGFKGTSQPLYTIKLTRPSSLSCGLFSGPAAAAAPRVGAEAAARAAQEAADAADKAAQAAADAAAEAAAAGGDKAAAAVGDAADAAAAAASPAAAAAAAQPQQQQQPRPHIRRPGETWRPSDAGGDSDDGGGGMMIPVLGIGAAYQGPVGKGLGFKQQGQGHGQHAWFGELHDEEPGEQHAAERHSGGGVVMWHAGEAKARSGSCVLVLVHAAVHLRVMHACLTTLASATHAHAPPAPAAGDRLVMAGLPAPGVQYAAGDDSDDPDAVDEAAGAAAPAMGQVRPRGVGAAMRWL
jgi:hypothetical protein